MGTGWHGILNMNVIFFKNPCPLWFKSYLSEKGAVVGRIDIEGWREGMGTIRRRSDIREQEEINFSNIFSLIER